MHIRLSMFVITGYTTLMYHKPAFRAILLFESVVY